MNEERVVVCLSNAFSTRPSELKLFEEIPQVSRLSTSIDIGSPVHHVKACCRCELRYPLLVKMSQTTIGVSIVKVHEQNAMDPHPARPVPTIVPFALSV